MSLNEGLYFQAGMSLKPQFEVNLRGADHPEMVINMDESELHTIEQIQLFLAASAEVAFTAHGDDLERYGSCWNWAYCGSDYRPQ